jgi:nucleoside-diphosphate-sugar epimerase
VIFLTGGTGFVGQRLTRQLTAEGRAVRVFSRGPRRAAFPPAVEWATGDLNDPSCLPAALKGAETVIHLAAALPGGPASASRVESLNVDGTRALASAACAAGVRRFIHVSSAGVYGDGVEEAPHREADPLSPATPYERSKLEAERALEAALEGSSVGWIILRPTGLYGPDRPATAAFFQDVAGRRLWLHGPTRVLVHPTHVLDLVGAIARALEHEDLCGEVLNVGGAKPVEFRELIALIGAQLGHGPLQVSAPSWSRHVADGMARVWRLLGPPPVGLEHLARQWVNRTVNIEKARRLLGFEPVSLEWGLDQTATVLREMGLLARPAARPPARQHG